MNGSGKTLAAVLDTLPSLEQGRRVLSTVRFLDWENPGPCDDPTCEHPCHAPDFVGTVHGRAHPLWVPWVKWSQLFDMGSHFDVVADEIMGVASSRDTTMPNKIANSLNQLRRADILFRWTAPAYARADKIIRETSVAITVCRGSFGVLSGGEDRRLWKQNRLFAWNTYDAQSMDSYTEGKRKDMKRICTQFAWGPHSVGFSAYETLEPVLALRSLVETGTCIDCGRTKRRQTCTCESEHEGGPARRDPLAGAARSPRLASASGPLARAYA